MIRRALFEPSLKLAVFAVLAVTAAAQVLSCRALYADGANFFVGILENRGFGLIDIHRLFANLFVQFPVVLAIRAGVTDMGFLRTLFSASVLLAPLLFWAAAFVRARRDFLFWPLLLLFSFVYFHTNFFAIGEYNLCFALAAYCLTDVLLDRPQRRWGRAFTLFAAALLSLDYAITVFLGWPLLAAALLRYRRERDTGPRLSWAALAGLYACAILTGLWEVMMPRDPANALAARDPWMLLHDWQLWTVLIYGAAVTLAFLARRPAAQVGAFILCAIALPALLFALPERNPFFSYGIRLYMGLAYVAVFCGAVWFRWRGYRCLNAARWRSGRSDMGFVVPVFALFCALSFQDMSLSLGYARYIADFRKEVDARTGLVPYELTPLRFRRDEILFSRVWTYPLMSLALRADGTKAVILNPNGFRGYQPFDPRQRIPDLSRYYGHSPEAR